MRNQWGSTMGGMVMLVTATCVLASLPQTRVAGQAAKTGTIAGRVVLTAEPPKNRPIRMDADPACVEINAGKRVFQEKVLRAADGGLANVFVQVKGTFPGATPPAKQAQIEQKGCVYVPRVQGAMVGQKLDVRNSDATLHNIHSQSTLNAFNVSQPKPGMVYTYTLRGEESMLYVRCDIHSWMTGYLGVLTHPYFGVTSEAGTFSIANVPPGQYTLQAWHEAYGPISKKVDVKAGATATVDFTYTGAEKPSGVALRELVLPADATAIRFVAER